MTATGKKEKIVTYVDLIAGEKLPVKSFYLITGSDSFAFREIVNLLKNKFLADDPSDFNFHRFDCDHNTKMSEIITLCEEYPFGARHKLVVLKDAQKLKSEEGKKLARYLENPSHTAVLAVLENEDEVKTSSSKFNPSRQLKKVLKQRGLKIACNLNYSQIRDWVRKRFESEGKKVSGEAVELLMQAVGNNLWVLQQEINKIVLYSANKNIVRRNEVESVTRSRPSSKIYNLTEQVGLKNLGKALIILDELFREKVAVVQILAALNNHFVFLYHLRQLSEQGYSSQRMAKELHRHPYYVKKSVRQAKNFTPGSFETVFDLLSRADGGIKSGMDERRVVEMMLIQVCKMRS